MQTRPVRLKWIHFKTPTNRFFIYPLMLITAITYRFFAPLLSAQFITADMGRPSVMRSLLPSPGGLLFPPMVAARGGRGGGCGRVARLRWVWGDLVARRAASRGRRALGPPDRGPTARFSPCRSTGQKSGGAHAAEHFRCLCAAARDGAVCLAWIARRWTASGRSGALARDHTDAGNQRPQRQRKGAARLRRRPRCRWALA